MKIITIFNFPDEPKYNMLCQMWLDYATKNSSDIPIEIWYESEEQPKVNVGWKDFDRVSFVRKGRYETDYKLNSPKEEHNIYFKLYNLCNETDPFIFIDADAILLKNIRHLIKAGIRKPVIMVNHQPIVGHTAHIPVKFLNSGVQVVSDPSLLDFNDIFWNNITHGFIVPGTDQALLFRHFLINKYDYTHPDVGFEWNNCAGSNMPLEKVGINHYWYTFKPWNINCPLWKEYEGKL